MKELIKFSIKRRFLNKATLFFNLLFLAIVLVLFNLDKIMVLIQPEINKPISVNTGDLTLRSFIKASDFLVEVSTNSNIKIEVADNHYQVISDYPLSVYQTGLIAELLQDYYNEQPRDESDLEYLSYYQDHLALNIEFKSSLSDKDSQNNVLAFMVVTTIYFMMISFSAMAANEVVYEKSTKLLEVILTTLSVSEHFYGKMLIGWLNILIQSLTSGIIVSVVFLWRYFSDKGVMLCACLQKMDLISSDIKDLQAVTKWLTVDWRFISDMFWIMLILMLGIVSVQVIMVSLSSFVSNVEEAGNIQSPMYILFMGLYYFSLSMNQPIYLEKGLGKFCSFLPVTSMLFMPYRIMLTKIPFLDILISLGINAGFLVLSLLGGRYLYGKGILYQKSGKAGLNKQTKLDKKRKLLTGK